MQGVHRSLVNTPHKWPVTRIHLMTSSCSTRQLGNQPKTKNLSPWWCYHFRKCHAINLTSWTLYHSSIYHRVPLLYGPLYHDITYNDEGEKYESRLTNTPHIFPSRVSYWGVYREGFWQNWPGCEGIAPFMAPFTQQTNLCRLNNRDAPRMPSANWGWDKMAVIL